MSIVHIESFEDRVEDGLLPKIDCGAGAGAGTVFFMVDSDAEQLVCRGEICDLVFFRALGLDFNRSFGSVFQVNYRAVIHVQQHQNTIAPEIKVGVGQ